MTTAPPAAALPRAAEESDPDTVLRGLLLRAGGGDGAAAARAYDATAPAAWRLALALSGGEQAARDLLLASYRAAWARATEELGGHATRLRPLPWLLRVVQETARPTTVDAA
ncbi:hypothetical protein [Nocardioides sambongensis]|uniref:hypothetical protein n=1 Tax=Nocardioides sambongensis TaxID=2589074 RepID=UPI00112B99E9|nr:hypothetical protein [Nocardioides sambongensis]